MKKLCILVELEMIDKKSNKRFLENLYKLEYPKTLIHLIINNKSNEKIERHLYPSFEEYNQNIDTLYDKIIQYNFDYLFFITNKINITNFNLINLFINLNIDCIAPLMVRKNTLWSNFWGAIDNKGFYARADDYFDIVKYNKKGVFKVPYISQAIFLKKEIVLKTKHFLTKNIEKGDGWDMAFCYNMRENGINMHIFNHQEFGYFLTDEQINNKCELTIFNFEHKDWEKTYLHEKFYQFIYENKELEYNEPISYAFDFPLFSEKFCDEIKEAAESNGNWSNGVNGKKEVDKRIGAIENVPTIDIHLKQFGMGEVWMKFLHKYMVKVLALFFPGVYPKGYNIAFIVKYEPSGQSSLHPHHDSSKYTLNVALSNYGSDYEGGGAHFIKTDYKHIGQKKGYCLIHPGNVTHYHAGLPTTKGTRHILVSFCN